MIAPPPPGGVRPLAREISGAPDPLALYAALCDEGRAPRTFLLESGDPASGAGERSIVGLSCALRIACHGRRVTIEPHSANGRSMMVWIADRLSRLAAVGGGERGLVADFPPGSIEPSGRLSPVPDCPPLAALRAVVPGLSGHDEPEEDTILAAGTFSYDLIDLVEELPPGRPEAVEAPLFELFVPDRLVVIDHRKARTIVVAHAFGGDGAEPNLHDAARAVGVLASAVDSAARGRPPGGGRPGVGRTAPSGAAEPSVDLSDGDYAALVARLKRHLEAGEVYQIVPSRTFSAPCPAPLAAYRRLRELDPSPYLFYIRAGATTLLGASPETAVRVDGSPRRVTVRPIAGTAGRGTGPDGRPDPDLDARREAALHLDAKETAEHMMLVDLARNDVARVSRTGTRRVTRLLEVERYAHVMHLVSEVQGELREDLDALDAYISAMNPGTLVGAPKRRAAWILRETEPTRRGLYGGAAGYLTRRGRMDTAIAIRSAVVRDGVARVRAGAGVVLDSAPEAEALETRRKAAAVLRAVLDAGAIHG